jgi:thiol-disulfide isomerase/thioredoxin
MKKKLFYLLGALLMSGMAYGIYFLLVISSVGTNKIKYMEPEGAYDSFAEILSHPDLKNKVVYVDFWHTGCKPCLVQFESVPKLKQHFADRDDLVFLYLGKDRSVPGEKFRWKKMIEKKDLSGYHYFMTDQMFEKIWDEAVQDDSVYKAFPHYLIVDKSGKVVNNNSPRPSSDDLVPELNRVLRLMDTFAQLVMVN